MIATILPKLYRRYVSLPVLGPVIDEFARWLLERGYSFMTVKGHLYQARHVDGSLYHAGVQALANLTHNHFEAAGRAATYNHSAPGTIPGRDRKARSPFVCTGNPHGCGSGSL